MKRTIFFLALSAATAGAYAAGGQVYKWTDAQGVVHYSDAPPGNTEPNVQRVNVSGGDRPHAVDSAPAQTPAADAAQTPADNGLPKEQVLVDNADNRKKACQSAHNNLDLLSSKFPVSVTGSDGKAKALDDASRQAQIADTNAQIALYCK
jgi:Domain of unknown function (DUF4124)